MFWKMARDEHQDDVELGEMEEEDAFINNGRYASKDYDRPGFIARWVPLRLKEFVENLSRIKVSLLDGGCITLGCLSDKSRAL